MKKVCWLQKHLWTIDKKSGDQVGPSEKGREETHVWSELCLTVSM